jgi:hypothetical protein
VQQTIARAVSTPEQAAAVYRVATTTLWLTTALLEQAYETWAAGSTSVGQQS